MKYLIAGKKTGGFLLVAKTGDASFDKIEKRFSPNILTVKNPIIFEAGASLHNDEQFYLEPTDDQLYDTLSAYEAVIRNTSTLNSITPNDYNDISSLLFFDTSRDSTIEIFFSRIYPNRSIIKNKTFLCFSPTGEVKVNEIVNSVEISGSCDAIWDGERIYFRSYNTVKPIFSGIADYYKIATPEQAKSFLESGGFSFDGTTSATDFRNKVRERNLKRVAAILDEGEIDLSKKKTRRKYQKYAEKYNRQLSFDEEKRILLKTNANLTEALKIIEENFYTSEVSGVRKESEASKRVD